MSTSALSTVTSLVLANTQLHGNSKGPVNFFVAHANPIGHPILGTLYLNWTKWRQLHGLIGTPHTRIITTYLL